MRYIIPIGCSPYLENDPWFHPLTGVLFYYIILCYISSVPFFLSSHTIRRPSVATAEIFTGHFLEVHTNFMASKRQWCDDKSTPLCLLFFIWMWCSAFPFWILVLPPPFELEGYVHLRWGRSFVTGGLFIAAGSWRWFGVKEPVYVLIFYISHNLPWSRLNLTLLCQTTNPNLYERPQVCAVLNLLKTKIFVVLNVWLVAFILPWIHSSFNLILLCLPTFFRQCYKRQMSYWKPGKLQFSEKTKYFTKIWGNVCHVSMI